MIFFWIFGDTIKMIFLIIQAQPLQFILSNGVLLAMEAILIILFFAFNKKPKQKELDPIPTISPSPLYREQLVLNEAGIENIRID